MPELCLSFVRITSANKSIRIQDNGLGKTLTIAEGVYLIGLGEHDGDLDDTWWGTVSLLQAIRNAAVADFGASDFDLRVEHEYAEPSASFGGSPTQTGHVWAKGSASGDKIFWGNAATTMDLLWFGRVSTSTSTIGTSYADVSNVSSSLVFTPPNKARSDKPIVNPMGVAFSPDSGNMTKGYYGAIHQREVIWRLNGMPRFAEAGSSNTYSDDSLNNYRRWIEYLNLSGAGGRFLFIPAAGDNDVGFSVDTDWDRDGQIFQMWGRQVFTLLNDGGLQDVDLQPTFDGYWQYWNTALLCQTVTAPDS